MKSKLIHVLFVIVIMMAKTLMSLFCSILIVTLFLDVTY